MAKTAIITGVGAGLGASLVQKFAQEGYQVGMFARSTDFTQSLADELQQQNLTALPVSTDITNPAQVAQGFAQVREQLGPVDLLINHAGNAAWGELDDLTPEGFEQSWRVCAYGSFLCSKEAASGMNNGGAILFTGATSSIRGRGGAIAFSSAKFGTRGLAWALARELWPKGIHVAHIIIDGVIDTPSLRAGDDVPDDEPLLDPNAIAQAYADLANQAPGAWTFEIDVRPNNEDFFG
ncbi:MAG: SDR family NAD(P)-dependent oxidoreductase [bacterium]|nr:SDR family NAD(P)-dependent oxidoreductase [bacterium]